jgi:hypothetical protein
MLASALIIAFSLVLLAYWFRASCRLLLQNSVEMVAAADERFSFPQVRAMVKTSEDLLPLHGMLSHDFRVLTYLREHAANLETGSIEDQLLILDYRVMQWYFRIMNKTAPAYARNALAEMATVVGVLAHKMSVQAEA